MWHKKLRHFADGRFTKSHYWQIVELGFLKSFLTWETFLEEAFILYLLGKQAPNGYKETIISAMSADTPTVSQLCPHCGLCCNGVLFADVELQKGDDAGLLIGLGLPLKKKGAKRVFVQPCACFDGKLCKIYAGRPARCRTFECGLLKRVQAGELEPKAALKRIAGTLRLVEKVRWLLRASGQTDERLALTHRYKHVMAAPIDLGGDEATAEVRGKLLLAVNDLMQVLQRDFFK